VLVYLQAKAGQGDQMLEALNDEVPVTASKDGCLSIEAIRDLDDRDRFVLVESWRDRDAYEAYLRWREEANVGGGALTPLLEGFSFRYSETVGTW
jgi:quinol monooxygenase YgiN